MTNRPLAALDANPCGVLDYLLSRAWQHGMFPLNALSTYIQAVNARPPEIQMQQIVAIQRERRNAPVPLVTKMYGTAADPLTYGCL
jgi:hypothetical protein